VVNTDLTVRAVLVQVMDSTKKGFFVLRTLEERDYPVRPAGFKPKRARCPQVGRDCTGPNYSRAPSEGKASAFGRIAIEGFAPGF